MAVPHQQPEMEANQNRPQNGLSIEQIKNPDECELELIFGMPLRTEFSITTKVQDSTTNET